MPDLQNLLDQIQERSRTAGDHVAKLCTKEDRWKMTVPVQDTDSDVLLTQITDHDVPQLAKALRVVIESCEETIRSVDNYFLPSERDHANRDHADIILDAITDALGATNGENS